MAEKQTVQSIVVDRLIQKIQEENRMPWHKPFQEACMNWFSEHEYMGINKILLGGGEYITPNQLEKYNEKHGTRFWFEKGTPYEIVVFYSRYEKRISDKQVEEIRKKPGWEKLLSLDKDGNWVRVTWTLRYYRVYNIKYVRDIINPSIKDNPLFEDGIFKKIERKTKRGIIKILDTSQGTPILKEGVSETDFNVLGSKLGKTLVENHTPADKIVEKYISSTGVKIQKSNSGAYYTHVFDSVFLPEKSNFASTEAYYRVLFHELIHSTGIKERLDRDCFHKYHQGSKERSKEELIAEIGGLLLASEAGFREDTEWADNSLEYVAGWCKWMKDNEKEVLNGMLSAEKAKNFILNGGKDGYFTEKKIGEDSKGLDGGEL